MLSIDKFGRWYSLDGDYRDYPVGDRGAGFDVDPHRENTYLMPAGKRLYDVGTPLNDEDCVNLGFIIAHTVHNFRSANFQYNALNCAILNVSSPQHQDDAVTVSYVNKIYPEDSDDDHGPFLHMKDRRVGELSEPTQPTDLVTIYFLTSALQTIRLEFQDVDKLLLGDKDCKRPTRDCPPALNDNA